MKFNTLILISFLFFLSCTKKDLTQNSDNIVIGAWQLEASITSNGASEIVNPVTNGQTINFKNDGSFEILNSKIDCVFGKFEVLENAEQFHNLDVISMKCSEGNTQLFSYFIENKKLFLTFLMADGYSGCDEICADRYRKLE